VKFYRFARALIKLFLKLIFRVKVVGSENVPESGGAILAINHTSNWDVLVVGTATPRLIRYMAKSEMFKNKLMAKLFRSLGAFPVQRGRGDVGAIKTALTVLNRRHILLMFPEGKRVRNNVRTEAKAGVAMIAVKAQVPIIPVRIVGDYKLFSKVTVIYGDLIEFSDYYDKKVTMNELQQLSNDVLDTIYNLEA